MFATGRNVGILQNQNPLTPQEESQLKEAFRPKYLQQLKMWFLVQKSGKKRKLLEFLNLAKTRPSCNPTRPQTSFKEIKPNDFILRSSTGTIDFRLAFCNRPCTRRNNRSRFESSGIRGENIFGESSTTLGTHSSSASKETLSQYVAKRLMNDDFAKLILPYADQNATLLHELQEWVDKKANILPVPMFSEPTSINPNCERTLNSKTIREDHLGRTRSSAVRSTIPNKQRIWHPPATAYNDFFGEELKYKKDKPFYPVQRTEPFCKFPDRDFSIRDASAVADNQAKINKEMGKQYRNIFVSKTVL